MLTSLIFRELKQPWRQTARKTSLITGISGLEKTYEGRTESWILEKSWNLPSNFPDTENVWRIDVKSWKNGKTSCFFENYNKCFTNEIFFVFVKSYSISPVGHGKSFVRRFFFRSLLITDLITLSLEKEIIVLERVLNFGSRICTNPDLGLSFGQQLSPFACPGSLVARLS